MCAHSPLSGLSVNESCAQDTERSAVEFFSFAPFCGALTTGCLACPLSIATVSCESGTSAKLVGTSVRLVGLRIWNERGARQNECETRSLLAG